MCVFLSFLHNSDLNALPCYKYERKYREKPKVSFQDQNLPTVTSVPTDMQDLTDHRLGEL